MAERVVLHIGSMKSGTSFLQQVLSTNRQRLSDHGILFAGRNWRQQVLAARDVIEHGGTGQEPLSADGPWMRLAEEIRAWPGAAVVSVELLGPRSKTKIEAMAASLGETDLQVVLTARDLGRQVPSMWTESVQNRGVVSWPDYLRAVRGDRTASGAARAAFWRQQGVADMAARWVEVVGRDHFTLVTVPPSGSPPTLLWERFARVAAIPADLCDLGVGGNPALDAAAAAMMRALNERLAAAGLARSDYERLVKRTLAKRGLAAVRRGRESVVVNEPWVRRRSARQLRKLHALDLRVEGDLDDLVVHRGTRRTSGVPGAEDQLDAALDGLVVLIQAWADEARRKGGRP